MKVAIAGKGGSGKTTVAAALARLFARHAGSALAVDGDSNPNLAIALGLPRAAAMKLPTVPLDVMERRTVDHADKLVLTMRPEQLVQRYGIDGPEGVRLLIAGRVSHAGAG